jgi:hypothetical protein
VLVCSARNTKGKSVSTDKRLTVAESTALLHAIFPRYPDLRGMNPAPEVEAFLLALRSQSLPMSDAHAWRFRRSRDTGERVGP